MLFHQNKDLKIVNRLLKKRSLKSGFFRCLENPEPVVQNEEAQIDLAEDEIIFCDPISDDSGDNCDLDYEEEDPEVPKLEEVKEKRLSFFRNRQLSLPKMGFGRKSNGISNSKTSPNIQEEIKNIENERLAAQKLDRMVS